MSRFNFTGKVTLNSLDSKIPWYRKMKTKDGKKNGFGVNLTISSAKNNRAFVESIGFEQDVIKTRDIDRNSLEVAWEDRENAEIMKKVNNKNVFADGSDRHEFIASYDFMKYAIENMDTIKDKNIMITGQVKKDFYNGKVRDRFQFSNIFVVDDNVKPKLKITTVLFWNKDGIDTADWKTEKRITISGYTSEYISKEVGNKYVPQTVILDCSKVDFSNERQVSQVKFRLKQLGLELSDEKIAIKIKNGKIYSNEIEISYYNGAKEIEFDENELTDTQKEMIELGIKTLDDFKPKGQIFGNRVSEWKVSDFTCKGNFADGMVVLDISEEEFENDIYTAPETETLENAIVKEEPVKKEEDFDVDDLFG